MRYSLPFLILLVIGIACSDRDRIPAPDDLLTEEEYLPVLLEIQLLDALVFTTDTLPNVDSLQQLIFDHYEIDENRFQRSHMYYASDTEEHQVRLDTVLSMIAREKQYILQLRDSLSSANR